MNVTDPDSKNLKAPRGYVQGYNAQAVFNEHQIVIAAEINTGSPDFGHLGPMVDAAQRELEAAGISRAAGVIVADAGYWHQQQMEQITGQGIPVLVPPDADKRKGTRPGWDGGPYAFMRAVLETEPARSTPTTRDRRAGLREHEVQPPLRPLPTPRQSRLPLRMAPHHRHPQPPQAPHRPQRRLRAAVDAAPQARCSRSAALRNSHHGTGKL